MEYRRFEHNIVLRVDPGEELLDTLRLLVKSENIPFARISGIGTVKGVTLAFYHIETGEYRSNYFPGAYEITTLMGNAMCVEGTPHVHVHTTIADRGHRIYGGHLRKAQVVGTCEVILEVFNAGLHRLASPDTGMNTLNFDLSETENC